MESTPSQRHRPAHPNLCQMALGKENFSLPTPSTHTQRSSTGLRSLTPTTSPISITSMGENEDPTITNHMGHHSVMPPPLSHPWSLPLGALPSIWKGLLVPLVPLWPTPIQRCRSISYKQSVEHAAAAGGRGITQM